MAIVRRRIGLEQEFFLVDEAGSLSDRADEFLKSCQFIAQAQGLNPNYFVAEFVKSMVEINTLPADTAKELARIYLKNLFLAISVAQQIGLRLYPLSSYPLPTMPVMRDHPNYHIQAQTVGISKFLHAGKCTGTHLHLEVPPGVIDPRVAVSYNSTSIEREELLNIYCKFSGKTQQKPRSVSDDRSQHLARVHPNNYSTFVRCRFAFSSLKL